MYISGLSFKKLNLSLICLTIVVKCVLMLTLYTYISSGTKNKYITGETTPIPVEYQHGIHSIQTQLNGASDPESSPTSARKAKQMGPPSFISDNHRELIKILPNAIKMSNGSSAEVGRLFAVLSDVVQTQLFNIQQQTNCSGTNFICGHSGACGLGCQIRHRMVCLMVSYALGIPLIHDELTGWAYSDSWSSVFVPIGSKCEMGPQTYRLEWEELNPPLTATHPQEQHPDQIEFPLKNGLLVSKEIADLVELIYPNPFNWWLGQYLKFAMQLRPNMWRKIEDAKKAIKFKKPVVGLHIRGTDKFKEAKLIPIENYTVEVKEYFRNSGNTGIKTVFVASEDATVLNATREIFYADAEAEQWNVIGFTNRKTLPDQPSRRDSLFEILTDLFLLADCDFVFCTLSSNVGAMLFDIQHYIYRDSVKRLKSLDGSSDTYRFWIQNMDIPKKIVKII